MNGSCDISYSNIIMISITPSTFTGSVSAVSPVCTGTASTLNLSGNFNTIQWQSSTDKATWTDINAATNPILNTATLFNTSYYRAKISYMDCPLIFTNIDSVQVNDLSIAGSVSGTNLICQGSSASLNLAAYRGNIQWQQSTDNINWNAATGNISFNTININNLYTTTSYRAVVANGSCPALISNVKTINVDSASMGGVALAVSPVCTGGSTTVALSGYKGSIQWQVSWNTGTTWANVTNAISPVLNLNNQTASAYYRAYVKNGVCPETYSVYDTVKISSLSVGGTATVTTPVCQGKTTMCYLYSSNGSIQWQESTDNINFADVTTGTNINAWNYTTAVLSSNKYYRAKVTNGACSTMYSTTASLVVTPTVIPVSTINISCGLNPQTTPADSVCFSAVNSNAGTTPVYQWKVNGITKGSNTSFKYLPANNDIVKCYLTSNAACASPTSVYSNSITMLVSKPKSTFANQTHYNYQTVCLNDKPFTLSNFTMCKYKDNLQNEKEYVFDPSKFGFGSHDIVCNYVDDETGLNKIVVNRISVINCNDKSINPENDFIVYPNPCSDEFNIVTPYSVDDLTITISDIKGNLVYTKYIKGNTTNKITIFTNGIKDGVYTLKIIGVNANSVKKLIIAR